MDSIYLSPLSNADALLLIEKRLCSFITIPLYCSRDFNGLWHMGLIYTLSIGSNHIHLLFIHIYIVRRMFYLDNFYLRNCSFLNNLPRVYFPEFKKINLFKSKANQHLVCISTYASLATSKSYIIITRFI